MLKKIALVLALACGPLCVADSPTSAPSGADAILAAIDALPHPDYDKSRSSDDAYVRSYQRIMAERWKRQDQLERQFYQLYPHHPQAEAILVRRWHNALTTKQEDAAQIQREVDQYLKDHPQGPAAEDVRLRFTTLQVRLAGNDPARLMSLAEAFAKTDPRNEQGANYFLTAAEAVKDAAKRDTILRRIIIDYPNSQGAFGAGGILRRASQIGMPFNLGFYEATTGKWTHTRWSLGKVIVINFWATWCPPCVGEIPHLKEVYAKYKGRGLEIFGVSLDGPGEETNLETLKTFVAKRQIPWPQYYQGEGFDSAFSASWGIDAIPAIFVIDQKGCLYSTDADRDKLGAILEKLLPAPK